MIVDRKEKINKKDLPKMSKQHYWSQKLHTAGEYHTSFQRTNVQHNGSLTEQSTETASLLENTEILFELHTDVEPTS